MVYNRPGRQFRGAETITHLAQLPKFLKKVVSVYPPNPNLTLTQLHFIRSDGVPHTPVLRVGFYPRRNHVATV